MRTQLRAEEKLEIQWTHVCTSHQNSSSWPLNSSQTKPSFCFIWTIVMPSVDCIPWVRKTTPYCHHTSITFLSFPCLSPPQLSFFFTIFSDIRELNLKSCNIIKKCNNKYRDYNIYSLFFYFITRNQYDFFKEVINKEKMSLLNKQGILSSC